MLYPLSYGGALPMADLDRVADAGVGPLVGPGVGAGPCGAGGGWRSGLREGPAFCSVR